MITFSAVKWVLSIFLGKFCQTRYGSSTIISSIVSQVKSLTILSLSSVRQLFRDRLLGFESPPLTYCFLMFSLFSHPESGGNISTYLITLL